MIVSGLHVLFDGIAYGMLLFLISVGLSVTMGLMGFVNLAHGAFAMIGGYVTSVFMMQLGWPFLATLPAAFVIAAAVGLLLERLLYRRLYGAGELSQVLLTIGVVYVVIALATLFWGPSQAPVRVPTYLTGQVVIGPFQLAVYRLFLIGVGALVVLLVVAGFEYTRFGARILAAVDNPRMAAGIGINVNRIFTLTFMAGSGLAGLGGALSINLMGLDPTFPLKYLVYFLIVVAVGGMGSIRGTLAAAILLGIFDVGGKYYFPQSGAFIIYLTMVVILFWRPAGLFGKRSQ